MEHPSVGGLRIGAEFENVVGELLYRLGFKIIDENVEIKCKKPQHQKKQHEADIICSFESTIFVKPWCSTPNLIVQCQHSLTQAESEKSARDLLKDIECFKKSGYNIDGGVLVTNLNLKNPNDNIFENVFFWELKRLFLYSFKVYTLADMKSAYDTLPRGITYKKELLREHEISKGLTFLWGVLKERKKERLTYEHNFECFHDVSRTRFNERQLTFLLEQIKKRIADANLQPAKAYIQIHSISGFTQDVKRNIKKMVKESSERGLRMEADSHFLFDYSVAPWSPILGVVYEEAI